MRKLGAELGAGAGAAAFKAAISSCSFLMVFAYEAAEDVDGGRFQGGAVEDHAPLGGLCGRCAGVGPGAPALGFFFLPPRSPKAK